MRIKGPHRSEGRPILPQACVPDIRSPISAPSRLCENRRSMLRRTLAKAGVCSEKSEVFVLPGSSGGFEGSDGMLDLVNHFVLTPRFARAALKPRSSGRTSRPWYHLFISRTETSRRFRIKVCAYLRGRRRNFLQLAPGGASYLVAPSCPKKLPRFGSQCRDFWLGWQRDHAGRTTSAGFPSLQPLPREWRLCYLGCEVLVR